MPTIPHLINAPMKDGENKPVLLDFAYSVTKSTLIDTVAELKQRYGSNLYLLPLSGMSCGGGILQVKSPDEGVVVGIVLSPTPRPRILDQCVIDVRTMALDEIVIDTSNAHIYAGSAITLEQLNQALTDYLGERFQVLGADLTSYTYAQVGATFMTGGMGPQRRYFSDSINQVALFRGDEIEVIEGDLIASYAGTYGWSGIVTAVRCDYVELPEREFTFAIPVSNRPESLARMLQHLCRYTYLVVFDGQLLTEDHGHSLILGIEHITVKSMQPMLASGLNNDITKRAKQLIQKCAQAEVDGLLFINGRSILPIDELLSMLVDDNNSDVYTIAGCGLEYAEIFNDSNQMRTLREAIPFAARTQEPKGKYIYKNHTDANLRLDRSNVKQGMTELWRANLNYVESLQNYIAHTPGLSGDIIIYGHLNPYGVDPHNRLTMACDDFKGYEKAVNFAEKQRAALVRNLNTVCDEYGAEFIGGEKSAGTEHNLFAAFGGIASSPSELKRKFELQSSVVRTTSPMFNWRALPLYLAPPSQ